MRKIRMPRPIERHIENHKRFNEFAQSMEGVKPEYLPKSFEKQHIKIGDALEKMKKIVACGQEPQKDHVPQKYDFELYDALHNQAMALSEIRQELQDQISGVAPKTETYGQGPDVDRLYSMIPEYLDHLNTLYDFFDFNPDLMHARKNKGSG